MYNPNDPQRKLRRPQPLPTPLERAIDQTRTAPVPAAGPLPNAPVLENPSITERAMSQGAIPTMRELPLQIGPAPNVPARPRTDAYRPPHLDSMEQYDPIAKARGDYMAPGRDIIGEELATPRRSFKQTLKTAGLGALQGLATGGIGGAIGGALGGAILGTASPRAARGYEFEMMQRPRIEEDLQRQMMLRKAQEEFETRNIGQAYTQEQMLGLRQGREARAAMLPYEIEQAQSRSEAWRAQANRYNRPPATPTRTPRTQIITTRDAQGRPVQRAVDPEEMLRTGQALPVYERPRVGRGGGGDDFKGQARTKYMEFKGLENNLRDAAEQYTEVVRQAQADIEKDVRNRDPKTVTEESARSTARTTANEKIKEAQNRFNAAVNAARRAAAELKAGYPDQFEVYNETGAFQFSPEGWGASPWPVVKQRGK